MSTLTRVDCEIGSVLGDAALERGSGVITAIRGKLRRIFCIDQGRVVHARSNVIEEQLSETLVKLDLVAPGDVEAAVVESRRQSAALGRLLADHGVVAEDALRDAQAHHVRELFCSTMDWLDGEATFEQGRPNLRGEVAADLECAPLLMDYARGARDLHRVRMRVGSAASRPVVSEAHRGLLEGLERDELVTYVTDQSDGNRLLSQILEQAPQAVSQMMRTLYGLMLPGILVMQSRARVAPRGEVGRDELVTLMQRSEGADHYTLLELATTCSQDQVRDAYYGLARRYHPDRFRSGENSDLVREIEEYFGRVTEAYNTLHDVERRKAYDELRASRERTPDTAQDTAYLARQNYLSARALIERGRFKDALTALENAVQLDRSNATYYLALGQLLARNPRYRQRAEQVLVEATRIDPALVDGYMLLGDLYHKQKRAEEAERSYREVLNWEPGHLEATSRLKALGAKVS